MASFMNTASQSSFDAESYAQQVASNRNSQRSGSGVSGDSGFAFWKTKGNASSNSYSVVGINTAKIPEMRQAIRTYVDNIEEHLKGVRVNTDPTIALRGTGMENAVKEYIALVVNYCEALCTNLLAFSDKLAKVEEAWKNSDTNMSSTINSASSDLSGAANSTYTEQFMG